MGSYILDHLAGILTFLFMVGVEGAVLLLASALLPQRPTASSTDLSRSGGGDE